jgi:hypothetical protein
MRIALAACGVALVFGTNAAVAQFGTSGTPIGKPFNLGNNAPVGQNMKPAAGQQVGNQVGSGVGAIPQMNSQDFKNIDKSRLAAPLPSFPGIGGGPTFWDRTKQKVMSVFTVFKPSSQTPAPKPNWVPGISRRNRERAQERREQAMQDSD